MSSSTDLEHEYSVRGAAGRADALHARALGRRPGEGHPSAAQGYGRALLYDTKSAPLILFQSEWAMRAAIEKETKVEFFAVAP